MCPPTTVSSSDSAVLLAAAEAAPSGRGIACGIVVAAVSQLGWGCYPVFARALQTQEPKLTIVELLVIVNGITATVLAASALASWLLRLLRRRCEGSVAPAIKASGAQQSHARPQQPHAQSQPSLSPCPHPKAHARSRGVTFGSSHSSAR